MPRKRPEVHIRKSEFPEGLRLCRENALSFLESAKILIDAKQINHAVILFQFAKEEAGKFAWLLTLSKELTEVIQFQENCSLLTRTNLKKLKIFLV